MAMNTIQSKNILVCLLLIFTASGVLALDLNKALENVKNLFKDAVKQAMDMAKQIGFDVKDLPNNLMQTAVKLFQLAQKHSSLFMTLLSNVKSQMDGDVSMDSIKEDYQKLLTNAQFVKESQELVNQHQNLESAGFEKGMEKLLLKYIPAGGGAGGLKASLLAVLMAILAYLALF